MDSDKVINEQLKYGGEELIRKLQEVFDEILKSQSVPDEWKKSDIILLHKKGNKHDINYYRLITIGSTIG